MESDREVETDTEAEEGEEEEEVVEEEEEEERRTKKKKQTTKRSKTPIPSNKGETACTMSKMTVQI